ncbi:Rho GTPase-activating protein 42, partial [Coemansia aciculifera]
MRARAIYACVAENPGEVTFDADDWLVDIRDSREDGWLQGTVQSTQDRGLFPVVYTELTPETGDDLRFLQKLQRSGLLSSALKLDQFARQSRQTPATTPNTLPPPVAAKPPVLAPKPAAVSNPKPPVLAPKPAAARKLNPADYVDDDPETRRQKEREAAELWESKFGIRSNNTTKETASPLPPPPASTKPAAAS